MRELNTDALRRMNTEPPDSYSAISFDVAIIHSGPVLPEQVYPVPVVSEEAVDPEPIWLDDCVGDLADWYKTIISCWEKDCRKPELKPRRPGVITVSCKELFLANEICAAGIRRLQETLFRDLVRTVTCVSTHQALIELCSLFHTIIDDDQTLVNDRRRLLVTIDDRVRNALIACNCEETLASMDGQPVEFEPDDFRILKLWSTLARADIPQAEVIVESQPVDNPPPKAIIEHAVPLVWRLWRQLDVPPLPQSHAVHVADVRAALDGAVKSLQGPSGHENENPPRGRPELEPCKLRALSLMKIAWEALGLDSSEGKDNAVKKAYDWLTKQEYSRLVDDSQYVTVASGASCARC